MSTIGKTKSKRSTQEQKKENISMPRNKVLSLFMIQCRIQEVFSACSPALGISKTC